MTIALRNMHVVIDYRDEYTARQRVMHGIFSTARPNRVSRHQGRRPRPARAAVVCRECTERRRGIAYKSAHISPIISGLARKRYSSGFVLHDE
jgi:hypothetical protein